MKPRILVLVGALLGAWLAIRVIRTSRYSVRDKVAVITGGSRGLGLVLARHICAQGGSVALIARDPDELARAKADLAPRGSAVLTIECDLLDARQIQSAVRQIIDRFGKIDILINNAGIIEVGPLENMTREDFDRAMRLHFWAPFELIAQVVPEMRIWGGGRIVNVSSIGARSPCPTSRHTAPANFALTRFFLMQFARSLRATTSMSPPLHLNDAYRLACKRKIQRQTRHGVCMVRCFGRGAVDLDEC
jgi:NAD(P)-dependent dehydrogenase (short-subunit alcohol dehydrogenase family)